MGAIFRNESHSICEWIEHYKLHGADHIYLINDASTDNCLEKIRPYIDDGFVTCVTVNEERYLGRQRNLYTTYFLPRVKAKEMKWLLICDMDEYVWSPVYSKLSDLLQELKETAQLQVNQTIYGSNGHDKQPPSVVAGFTRRSTEEPAVERLNTKYFVNSDHEFSFFNVHHATFAENKPEYKVSPGFMKLGPDWLIMNHYSCQSREFWETVKCTRGDADNWWNRTMPYHSEMDFNDVEDTRLMERNKSIVEKILTSASASAS